MKIKITYVKNQEVFITLDIGSRNLNLFVGRNGKYQEQLMFQAEPVPRRLQDDNLFQTQRPIGIRFNANLATNEGTSTSHPITIQGSTGLYEKTTEALNLWPTRPGSAWRNFSYTDLITLAIFSTSDRRMTVKEIYAWVARNIPHFYTKKYEPAASGWKNTIRHTLSIRKRFVRIPTQRERRSLWTIKPEYLHVVFTEISQKISADGSFMTPDYDHTTFYPGYSSLPCGAILMPRPSSSYGKF
ncbi:forkhead box protein O-like [Actinia tenebrosa]|uniref:Forkhead box protein O-like n=1 Tax=Actinia tenebrosa TaxID=6105 RepID=A0A6P8JAA5_ACTTE|nr:forkhead box protein O-like [Actinia tenebrosa]